MVLLPVKEEAPQSKVNGSLEWKAPELKLKASVCCKGGGSGEILGTTHRLDVCPSWVHAPYHP